MDNQYLKNIKKGMKVEILTAQNKISRGIVDDVASRVPYHFHGIMVRLKNGEIGRVQRIILNESEQNKKNADEVEKLLKLGENYHNEFKSEALWSQNYNSEQLKQSKSIELREFGQKASKVVIAKSIAGLMNSDGGTVLLGITENKTEGKFEITGLDRDLKNLKDPGYDGFRRMLIDEIIRQYFPSKIYNHLNDYVIIDFAEIDLKTICIIKIKRSDSRVFLKLNDREVFIIRVDSENRTLEGEKLVEYCIKHWQGK